MRHDYVYDISNDHSNRPQLSSSLTRNVRNARMGPYTLLALMFDIHNFYVWYFRECAGNYGCKKRYFTFLTFILFLF